MDSFFKNKTVKTLILLFIFVSMIHILFASILARGIVSDGIWNFYSIVNNDSISTNFDQRMRLFSCLISQLPVFLGSAILKISSKEVLLFFFSLPLFLYPFLVTFWNFKLAERSKRYDIAILSLALFVFGVLFFEWYAIVELFIVVPLYWVLFHYLVCEFEYKNIDIAWIILLSAFTFYSHEFIGVFGFLLFFASLLYARKESFSYKTKVIKYCIGFSGLFSALIFWVLYLTPYGPELKSDGGISDISAIFLLFEPDYLIFFKYKFFYFILLAVAFYSLLIKKKLNNYSVIFITTVLFAANIAIFIGAAQNKFLYLSDFINFSISMRFTAAFYCIAVFLYIIFKDFIQKLPSSYVPINLKNLFISSLVVGIFSSILQLFWTVSYKNVVDNLLLHIESSNEVIVDITKYKERKYYYAIFPPEYAPLVYFFVSKNMKKNLIVPPFQIEENSEGINFYRTEFCYDKDFDIIYSYRLDGFYYDLDIIKKYWDLSNIKHYMIKNNMFCK